MRGKKKVLELMETVSMKQQQHGEHGNFVTAKSLVFLEESQEWRVGSTVLVDVSSQVEAKDACR
jgi:hypothetical protein